MPPTSLKRGREILDIVYHIYLPLCQHFVHENIELLVAHRGYLHCTRAKCEQMIHLLQDHTCRSQPRVEHLSKMFNTRLHSNRQLHWRRQHMSTNIYRWYTTSSRRSPSPEIPLGQGCSYAQRFCKWLNHAARTP